LRERRQSLSHAHHGVGDFLRPDSNIALRPRGKERLFRRRLHREVIPVARYMSGSALIQLLNFELDQISSNPVAVVNTPLRAKAYRPSLGVNLKLEPILKFRQDAIIDIDLLTRVHPGSDIISDGFLKAWPDETFLFQRIFGDRQVARQSNHPATPHLSRNDFAIPRVPAQLKFPVWEVNGDGFSPPSLLSMASSALPHLISQNTCTRAMFLSVK
jgi:hypothetical protein